MSKQKHEPTRGFRVREGLRRGNAAQPHADGRNKRERARGDAKNSAVRRSSEGN